MTLKLRKLTVEEIITQQLPKELKILVSVGKLVADEGESRPEQLSDFGIRAVNYKLEDSLRTLQESRANTGTYFLTSDVHEASQLWCPQIFSTSRTPIGWTMRYIVPRGAQVVSCGQFTMETELSHNETQ